MARKPALTADVQADVTDSPSKSRSYGVNHFRLLGRMTADPQMRFRYSPTSSRYRTTAPTELR